MRCTNRREPTRGLIMLMAIMRRQSAPVCSRNPPAMRIPALLTSRSGVPCSSHTQSVNCRQSSRSATSRRRKTALPPVRVMRSTVSAPVASLMSETTMVQPLRPKRSAVARPMPLPAPVTTATGMSHLPGAP
ncbi:Uncharacterised protein [Mycobacteroides abscessus subsp. abscessus]|nr:Uncharacterised protein [Mycobacteroides abscessus subsp. abscessus]